MKLGGVAALCLFCIVFPSHGAEYPKEIEEILRANGRLRGVSGVPLAIVRPPPPPPSTTTEPPSSTFYSRTCTESGSIICDSCSKGRICSGNNIGLPFTCSSGQYCTPGEGCRADNDKCKNKDVDPDFICSGPGVFPVLNQTNNTSDCSELRICSAANVQALKSSCSAQHQFDPKKSLCVKGAALKCANPCEKSEVGYASSPDISPYYVFCLKRMDTKYIMFKCDTDMEFSDGACQKVCTANTPLLPVLPRDKNCNKYYVCTTPTSGSPTRSKPIECPKGLFFNGNSCVVRAEAGC